jgi:hypothetical protein
MATQINYYTREEALTKVCPRVNLKTVKGELKAAPLNIHCVGDMCLNWIWSRHLNDEGKQQGTCGNMPKE